VADLAFEVIESLGGHVPGQVFFYNRAFGLLFTSDYLLHVSSLSREEQDYLRLPRYLMTSTNTNSDVFRKETAMLRGLVREENKRLGLEGRFVRIFPGHGDYYQDLDG
jgi:glyoxylase-like metal-dependent hydrolase (beta-lactamase superfamily II)